MSKYDQIIPKDCPVCGAIDEWREVQTVIATQAFSTDGTKPYSDIETWECSEADWESSDGLYVECSSCNHIVVDFREEGA